MILPQKLGYKQIIGQLYGSSLSLTVAEYCTHTTGAKLIIADSSLSAYQCLEELRFFLKDSAEQPELLLFPDWETLPYDTFSPHQDIISARLTTLKRLQQATNIIVVVAVSTIMHRIIPTYFLNKYSFALSIGQTLNFHSCREQLQTAGYYCVNQVRVHGEFAIRGALMDIYPMGSELPLRIELFDDKIDSLRTFNPDTQRTINKITQIALLPARECPLTEDGIGHFRSAFRSHFSGNPSLSPLYDAVSQGRCFGGMEYYLPLFFTETGTLFDYLPTDGSVCLLGNTQTHAEAFWHELEIIYNERCHDITRPILAPQLGFLNPTELLTTINTYKQVRLYHDPVDKKGLNVSTKPPPDLPIIRQGSQPFAKLAEYITTHAENRYVIIVASAGRREVLLELLRPSNINPIIHNSWDEFKKHNAQINLLIGPLVTGVVLSHAQITILTETELFGEQSIPQRRTTKKIVDPDLIIRDLSELRLGAPVVHIQFGVGRYQGLQYIENNGVMNEFLILGYAGDDKIYVPVTNLSQINRYTGADNEHAPLHKLGSDQWQKAKKKAIEKIHDVAIALLNLYAQRAAKPGHIYKFDATEYENFASAFPFLETADQANAIQQIIQDLLSPRPMDRLICGDVGFGKTEVAMRAAFIAVQNGKQVCVLVPTTLLAAQHFDTFRDRFAEWPVRIELLSRFRTSTETKQVLSALQDGKVDIVIGTHKLFQKDIRFYNLGLLVIDEEHRFGVKQKEHIKELRTDVDVLSMTATPIPRTLNMAMHGIRDVSLIATPPAKRLSIKTFWQERSDTIIREAIWREIYRGGQVFFLHNNVQTINHVCADLQKLVPEAKIQIAHGQMRERELERIMADFYHHRFNVLICTTIIETGIDIPTANTILIDRADTFGLAQLHQLRGRVGRSHHQAYAYLLTRDKKLLTADSTKRLNAVISLEDLGAGFTLATHDLEIRGAGDLLGEGQSGNIQAIGFHLFMEMLDTAITSLKVGKDPVLDLPMQQGTEVDLGYSAIIPDDYIADIHLRLIFYKRVANASDKKQLHDLQIELIDRFGLLPPSVKQLFAIIELKQIAAPLQITKIHAAGTLGKLEFKEQPNINAEALIKLIQVHSKRYQMDGPTRLKFTLDTVTAEERVHEIKKLLITLMP